VSDELCPKHDLRLPCPDCMTPNATMLAEGYAVHGPHCTCARPTDRGEPTPAQRAAYAARVSPDETPRPWWRWHEHWESGALGLRPTGHILTDAELREAGLLPVDDLDGHADAWRH
jgi:hypothetical protein